MHLKVLSHYTSIILGLKNLAPLGATPTDKDRLGSRSKHSKMLTAEGRVAPRTRKRLTLGKLEVDGWGQVIRRFGDPGRTPDFTERLDQEAFQMPPYVAFFNIYFCFKEM